MEFFCALFRQSVIIKFGMKKMGIKKGKMKMKKKLNELTEIIKNIVIKCQLVKPT